MQFIPNPKFRELIESTLGDLVHNYSDKCHEVITESRYWADWNPPQRGFRDIVDTGTLRDSQDVYQLTSSEYEISWQTPYVGNVYFGDGYYPGRPWAEIAWDEYLQENP